jgi:glutamate-5-semialdehyde dehydrogenase
MNVQEAVHAQLKAAREASRALAQAPTGVKNSALAAMSRNLRAAERDILAANRVDVENARKAGLPAPLIARLALDGKKLEGMAQGVDLVASLPDPVGQVPAMWQRPNGLVIGRKRVPLGVVAMVYESRPNVTSDVAALALKSGNAAVLRGGEEAYETNLAVVRVLKTAVREAGLPEDAVQFIETLDRAAVTHLLEATGLVDVVIPRGGENLIRLVVEKARVPVIFQFKGVCHTFVDASADLEMATRIAYNAKVSNPAVCNAMECLLVHERVAEAFLPRVAAEYAKAGVEIRGDETVCRLVPAAKRAEPGDYGREFLALVLAVKVVKDLDAALAHIARYGSHHSECIVTNDYANSQRFLQEVDAACVYVNASTRFTDGGEFGFGAEVGISTQKLHVRGPMGLEELTTVKYVIYGSGQIR